jgi:pyruvate/oxaloacetate carboxyltransferase
MKSALELALEKTARLYEGGTLTDAQRAAIAELEKMYQAKIAEQEIMTESKIKAAAVQMHGAEFSALVMQLREQLAQEKARIGQEKAAKIQAVREEKK